MKAEQSSSITGRRYRQSARAESSARTREAILDATVALVMEKAAVTMSLADIAGRAGVSVQTVLRHFGTRDDLLDAALRHGNDLIAAERRAPEGDVRAAIRALFDHYEERGDAVIRLLGQEDVDERIALVTSNGRTVHREWARRVLAADGAAEPHDDVVDKLVIVTDVYAWKILRRDRGLARADAERRVRELVETVLEAAAQKEGAS